MKPLFLRRSGQQKPGMMAQVGYSENPNRIPWFVVLGSLMRVRLCQELEPSNDIKPLRCWLIGGLLRTPKFGGLDLIITLLWQTWNCRSSLLKFALRVVGSLRHTNYHKLATGQKQSICTAT